VGLRVNREAGLPWFSVLGAAFRSPCGLEGKEVVCGDGTSSQHERKVGSCRVTKRIVNVGVMTCAGSIQQPPNSDA